jgi:outer membrane protein assembly factor BamB/tetratricopeptide (TPR) repeat protein
MPRSFGSLVALLLLLGPARGDAEEPSTPFPFAVRDTNAARFAVADARRRIEESPTDMEALAAAQRVLDELPDDVFVAATSPASTLWRPAAEEMRDRLAALSPEGRAAYARRARPATEPLLARALRRGDRAALEDLLDRFGASPEGQVAARLLAEGDLESGRPADAAHAAREGLRYRPADSRLWLLLVDALERAGDGEALARLEPPSGLVARAGGKEVRVVERLAEARRRHPIGEMPAGRAIWGGTPSRSAAYGAAPPLPAPHRWRQPAMVVRRNQDDEARLLRDQATLDRFDAFWEDFRPLHPVADERMVFVEDGLSIRAYDLYSGVERWGYDAGSPGGLPLLRGTWLNGRTSFDRCFSPLLHGDLVIGTVEVGRPYDPERLQNVEISTYLPRRVLVALRREDGRPVWWLGSRPEAAARWEDLSVVSPPVVADGLVLFVAARHQGFHEVHFVAVDVATGALAWIRRLGQGNQELNLFGAPVKELSASPVAVADGIAYASTGLGFVAAVEARRGGLRWLASYEIQPIERVEYWYKAPLRFPAAGPAPPVVRDGLLIVAPPDGRHLQAFDARTGASAWRVPYPPRPPDGAVASFLGVAESGGRAVALLAHSRLEAIDLATGEMAWYGVFDGNGWPVGLGAVCGDEVLVPTRDGVERFSLRRQGKLVRRDPWPDRARPGNLLPLSHALLVTSRDSVQAFYSWEEIERDLQARRRARPRDPRVRVEAGEVYRLGGELDRAEEQFREALALAGTDAAAQGLARQGLRRTYLAAGDAAEGPARALAAYREALSWADNPPERVEARLRIDRSLGEATEVRAQNLEAIVEEAEGALGEFDPDEGHVPARAAALLRLAEVRALRREGAAAADALQRILVEEGDAPFPDGPARQRARTALDAVIAAFGPEAYARHEAKARELLAAAERSGDRELLDRILQEYPNAAVVPDALLTLGERLATSAPEEGIPALVRFLADHGNDGRVPRALASLARALGRVGAEGARGAVLHRIRARHGSDPLVIDGRATRGEEFAALEPPGPERRATETALAPPLREAHFESVGESEYPHPVAVASDPGDPCPIALAQSGTTVFGIDLARARVAFREPIGPFSRAAYAGGVLVAWTAQELRGHSVEDGRLLWEAPAEGIVVSLEAARGVVAALVREAGPGTGERQVLALDATTGTLLWQVPLEEREGRRLVPVDGDFLLEETVYSETEPLTAFEVLDGICGAARGHVDLPSGRVEAELVAGARLALITGDGRGARTLSVISVPEARREWDAPLPEARSAGALLENEEGLWLLQHDGSLVLRDLATGRRLHETRVYLGEQTHAAPYPGTRAHFSQGRLVLIPWVAGRNPVLRVVAYDRRTGKLAWESPFEGRRFVGKAGLEAAGDLLVASVVSRDGNQSMTIRLLEAATGSTLQEIDPQGLSRDWPPTAEVGGSTLLVIGRRGIGLYAGG